ncbi:signal peptidase 22 kDa subunit [Violaceomyces palustris]|uniref:Signal peptidase 22 kDa subunit n=1 Tax=Violaceomyces palustris TaxID=1673888 RepID=A0ACD0NPB4_9BASI|nr:signal peptidase 22 kDa subunit [Violaceomyces palustris]
MHSTVQRFNAVTALATSVILCLLAMVGFTSFPIHKPNANVLVNDIKVISGRAQWHMDRRTQDFLETRFDVDVDLSSLFNWNTKQVFVYLSAEYDSKDHELNQAVIWDRIVRRKEDAHVVIKDQTHKYGLRSVNKSFDDVNNVTLTLKWNVMPKVGWLTFGDERGSGSIRVPSKQLGSDGAAVKPQRLYY